MTWRRFLLDCALVVLLTAAGIGYGRWYEQHYGAARRLEPGVGFRAPGAEVETLAVMEDGTRIYRILGPKMIYASIVVVGPDSRAVIRQ